MARRAGALTVVTAAGVLLAAGPAAADVTVSPATASQGGEANLSFHVTNTGSAPVTEVTVRIPDDTPIAEVYPLSVDDWAPKIEWRDLSTPLTSIHNGSPVDQAPSAITWIAMGGKAIAPGKAADLRVAVGPLPLLSSVRFAVEAKYADGKAAPAMPAASLALIPSGSSAPATHHGGAAAGPADGLSDGENAAFEQIVANAERGPSVMSIAGWVVAALALLGAGWVFLRNRHRAEEEPGDGPSEPDEKSENEPVAEPVAAEPVAAGSSRWSFKG